MSDRSKKSSGYFQSNQMGLGSLLSKVKEWEAINQRLASLIDPVLWKYCRAGSIENHELVILAANGSVAAQLRFQTTDILKKFKTDSILQSIKSIHCKVLPSFAYANAPRPVISTKHPVALLSPQTAAIVKEIAQTIEDQGVKKSMLQIATRIKKAKG